MPQVIRTPRNATCIGIVGNKDNVRLGVKESVALCRSTSITFRMVTGDNITTVKAIARECGKLIDDGIAIEGPDFCEKSFEALLIIIPKIQVRVLINISCLACVSYIRRLWQSLEMELMMPPTLHKDVIGLAMGIAALLELWNILKGITLELYELGHQDYTLMHLYIILLLNSVNYCSKMVIITEPFTCGSLLKSHNFYSKNVLIARIHGPDCGIFLCRTTWVMVHKACLRMLDLSIHHKTNLPRATSVVPPPPPFIH
ncbi:calcium-transporting ATPase 2, plasma membrane-type-like protein, partial [Tanacetum coccineum]